MRDRETKKGKMIKKKKKKKKKKTRNCFDEARRCRTRRAPRGGGVGCRSPQRLAGSRGIIDHESDDDAIAFVVDLLQPPPPSSDLFSSVALFFLLFLVAALPSS